MGRILGAAVGAAALFSAGVATAAPDPSGRTVGVSPAAYATGEVGYRVLALEQAVYMGDRVDTGAAGEAQLLFNDNTRLVVGPNASLQIDSFVVKDGNKLRSFALTALRGVYRFSTGNGPKQAYNIRTPAMTLGIRGTKFDFSVAPDGSTDFVLLEGSARVCDRGGNCIVASDPCTFISIPTYAPMRRVTGSERAVRLGEKFPYVAAQQGRLRRDFQFNVSSCGNLINTQSPETNPTDRRPNATPGPALAAPGPAVAAAGPAPSPSVSVGSTPSPSPGPTAAPSPSSPSPSSPSPSLSDPGKGNNGRGNGGRDNSPNGKSDNDR